MSNSFIDWTLISSWKIKKKLLFLFQDIIQKYNPFIITLFVFLLIVSPPQKKITKWDCEKAASKQFLASPFPHWGQTRFPFPSSHRKFATRLAIFSIHRWILFTLSFYLLFVPAATRTVLDKLFPGIRCLMCLSADLVNTCVCVSCAAMFTFVMQIQEQTSGTELLVYSICFLKRRTYFNKKNLVHRMDSKIGFTVLMYQFLVNYEIFEINISNVRLL